MRGSVEHVGLPAVLPATLGEEPVEDGHEQGRALEHRDVDDLADARLAALEDGAEDADREQHPAPAVVAEEVERRHRSLRGTDRVEGTGEREVVDVVARHLGVRPVLAPARHARVHESRVAGEQIVGSDAETLGGAGAVHVDERVGVGGERIDDLPPAGILHVDGDGPLAATHERVDRLRPVDLGDAVDPHDVGAETSEQHAAEGRGPEAAHHDDAGTDERTAHVSRSWPLRRPGR